MLLDHDPRQQIGVIEKTEIGSDAVLRADVRFGNGALADEVFQDEAPLVIGTGGFAQLFSREKLFDHVVSDLILTGLLEVARLNR